MATLLVRIYFLVHGRLHLPGAGWLMVRFLPYVRGLWNYPLVIPGVGTAILDFRDQAAFGMLNTFLGELWDDRSLHAWLKRLLGPESILWDVGANVGYLSMHLVRPPAVIGAIEAFEPNPNAFRTLSSLFHDHPKVRTHNVGLGNRDAELELSMLRGSSAFGSVTRQFQDGDHVKVRIRHADAYRREKHLPLPDVIKIDVEGYEPQVVEGLAETIRLKRPILVVEHHFLDEVQLRQLTPPGYTMLYITGDDALSLDFSKRAGGRDAILVPQEKVQLAPFAAALAPRD